MEGVAIYLDSQKGIQMTKGAKSVLQLWGWTLLCLAVIAVEVRALLWGASRYGVSGFVAVLGGIILLVLIYGSVHIYHRDNQ